MNVGKVSIRQRTVTAGCGACGFIAGTTFGSGLSFLLEWQNDRLILCVALSGLAGTLLGCALAQMYVRWRQPG